MATVTQRKQRRRIFSRLSLAKPTGGRSSRRRWIIGSVLAALLLVWLIPVIVAHSFLLNWIVGLAAADLDGEVRVGSASLGWFSPIELGEIEVLDAQQQPLASIASVTGDRSLLKILWNTSNVGRFRIEGPRLSVVLRPDGSNVEDALAAYLAPSEEPSSGVDLGLDVVDGTISITDTRMQQSWQIERFQLALTTSADPSGPLELETSGSTADATRPGQFEVGLKLRVGRIGNPSYVAGDSASSEAAGDAESSGGGSSPGSGDLTLRADALPLAMFESLVGRFVPEARLNGRLCSTIQCQWSGTEEIDRAVVQGSVTADDFTLAMPGLGRDRVTLAQLKAVCQVAWQEGKVQVDRAVVHCDVGNASLVGTLDLGQKEAQDLLTTISHQSYELDGRIDLARLARMLPDTLHVREGTEITAGRLEVAMASRPGPDGMAWLGRLEARDLAAVNQGRRLVWQQPILVNLAARETKDGPVVESLKCQSSFLQLDAAGTPDELTATANFDLDKLAAQLAGLVDLGGIEMAGGGAARLSWKRSDDRQFQADAQLGVQDFQLSIPSQQIRLKESLSVNVAATGRTDFGAENRLETATLSVQAGQDRIDARLLQPVLDFKHGGTWPLDIKMQGQLAQWLPRLRPWIALDEWNPAGSYTITVQGTGSAELIDVRRAQLSVQQFRVQGHGLNIQEPKLELVATGRWDQKTGRLDLKQAALTGTNLSVRADNVVYAPAGEAPGTLAGTVAYKVSVDRLQQWTATSGEPPDWRVLGNLAGTARVSKSGDLITGALDTTITNLVATSQAGKRVARPEIRLVADGNYDCQSGLVRLDAARLTTDGLACTAAGRIDTGAKQTNLQLTGGLDYDLQRLAGLWQPLVGNTVRVTGRGSQPLSYRGLLDPAGAEGEAAFGWASVDAYGFRGGPAALRANLSRGLLQIQPLEMDLNEGRLNLASTVRVAPGPVELNVQRGSAARQIRIDPAMCANALKYIAPVLADVAAAEGLFSIELDDCRVPLADPAKGELKGRFVIHSVEVGPGPLVRELAILLGRATPARLTRESVVPFQMVNGRVYHQGLELEFPDLTIRTHGSVGLDHTLLLMAEMPVPPKWVAGNTQVASALRNQTISLPINGTLERPQIDQRTLQQLSRQFMEKAAENVIKDEVKKQLDKNWDKIFRPFR